MQPATAAAGQRVPATSSRPGTNPDGPEEFITKEEVARRLKKTTRTIEHWQRRGYIPFVKVQQSVLFRWSSVVAQLERRFGVGLIDQ